MSWLVLRGKCRDCAEPISWRYPFVELATGVFFAGVAWWALAGAALRDGRLAASSGTVIVLAAFLYLAAISVALTMIDLDTHKLPNTIVLPAYVVGIALLGAESILAADYEALIRGGIGLTAMFVPYLLMALAYPGGMGFGDVKLAGVLGLSLGWLGWGNLLVGSFGAFLLGGIFSIALLVLRKVNRKSGIPFGPWMLAGAWLGIFFGDTIWTGYLALFGLGNS
jgi:leader peptidase (prepilin peptidase)/N-methyltransferase